MDELNRKLLSELEKGIPLVAEPFKEISAKLKITPKEVITRIIALQEKGVIRRFGASIKPDDVGLFANALVAWKIPVNRVQEVGVYLSKFKEITHCYQRRTVLGRWEYNLYTVMHAQEKQTLEQQVRSFSEAIKVNDYIILYSIRALKKTSAALLNVVS